MAGTNDNSISKSFSDLLEIENISRKQDLHEMLSKLHKEKLEEKEKHFKLCKAAVLDITNALNINKDMLEKIQAIAEHENLIDETIFPMEEHLRQFSYAQKLKMDIKKFSKFNSELETNLKLLQQEYEATQVKLNGNKVPEDVIRQLEQKIKTYEMVLAKMHKSCPWLNEEFHSLISLEGELKKLQIATCQKESLQSQIDTFCGLKPNLIEAKQQLCAIKKQYERALK